MTAVKVFDVLIEKGTVWSGLCFAAGFLTSALLRKYEDMLGMSHEQFDDFRADLFYMWCVLGVVAILYKVNKTQKLNLKIAAAQVIQDPDNMANASPVPEVQQEVDRIIRKSHQEGVPVVKGRRRR